MITQVIRGTFFEHSDKTRFVRNRSFREMLIQGPQKKKCKKRAECARQCFLRANTNVQYGNLGRTMSGRDGI